MEGAALIMGLQDRDWYRDAMREKEKQQQLDATRSKFSSFTDKHLVGKHGPKVVKPARELGLLPLMLFWIVVMGLLYGAMTYYLKPKQAKVLANGELMIQRSQDGHFYTLGKVNGIEVTFMVDTGASLVTISETLAQKASLSDGTPTIFQTANGKTKGRVVEGLSVTIGPVAVTNIKVGVGLVGGNADEALLGQSFLSKFDISMNKDQLILRPR
jgi:aspartyl protease family protein